MISNNTSGEASQSTKEEKINSPHIHDGVCYLFAHACWKLCMKADRTDEVHVAYIFSH